MDNRYGMRATIYYLSKATDLLKMKSSVDI